MNILLCIQYHDSDKPQAFRLARLIHDIEPHFRPDVRLLMVRRFDCQLTDHDAVALHKIEDRFTVETWQSKTKWVGWPGGCNGIARDLLIEIAVSKSWRKADGVILLEPDCIPFRRDWIDALAAEWLLSFLTDRWLMGAWRDSGGQHGHINGNMVCRPDIAKLLHFGDIIGPDLAWDAAIAPYAKDHWQKTNSIVNAFQSLNATESSFKPGTVLVHGYKDDSAYNLAREAMGL